MSRECIRPPLFSRDSKRAIMPHTFPAYDVVSHLHETTLLEGKTVFKRGPSLCISLYSLYSFIVSLALSPFFFIFIFFFLCASTYFSCFFRIFSNDVADTGFAIECKKVFILNRDVQGFRLAYNNGF